MVTIPQRLQKRVAKAEIEHIEHRLFAEVVVDSENALLGEEPVQRGVQGLSRGQVAAEWLFNHHPGTRPTARIRQAIRHGGEHAGGDGQIVQRMAGITQDQTQALECRRVEVITVDVGQPRAKLLNQGGGLFGRLKAGPRPRPQLVGCPVGFRHANHRDPQQPAVQQIGQGGENLFISQVTRGPKKDQRVRCRDLRHDASPRQLDNRSQAQPPVSAVISFPDARQTGTASLKAACPGNQTPPATKTARTAPWSAPAREHPRQWPP